MTPEELSEAIALALEETISSGQLTLVEGAELPAVRVERPQVPRTRRLGNQRRSAAR